MTATNGRTANMDPTTLDDDTLAEVALDAAAPDLLAALTDLVEQLEAIGIPEWSGAEGLCLAQSRAAITKATTT